MNLIIDVGNTSVKLAIFKQRKLIFKEIVPIDNIRHAVGNINNVFKDVEKAII